MSFKYKIIFTLLLVVLKTNAQINDSINQLNHVVITSFKRSVPFIETTGSVAQITPQLLQTNSPERILESVNLIPGSKIEERSPGSYRVSMRGSTIRSPFGVRNVKIYFDDFIFTDASGNSYLNLIDPSFITSIDILKGPQGGEYGSETGGALVLNSTKKEQLNINLLGGSFATYSQKFNYSEQLGKHFFQIAQAYHNTESYREQSAVNRKSFFLKDNWKYSNNSTLNTFLLYTDIHYKTPGGLTLQQMQQNRRQARLATVSLPSAVVQDAGIYNKTVLGGISHHYKINDNWSNFALLQTSYTDFKNPFISNYEIRKENNLQGRFFVQYQKKWNTIEFESRVGFEAGYNQTGFKNFDNNRGEKGNAQKFDDLKTNASFYYLTQRWKIKQRIFVDANLSLNTLNYQWQTTFPIQEKGRITFKNQWLPSLGITYKVNSTWYLRGRVAKGTSSPTTEEVRSSNQNIAQNLLAEYGWNKEIGIRKQLGSLFIEATLFDYDLKDAIVKRQDENGNDYFINSGGTKQLGVEFLISSKNYKFNNSIFTGFQFRISGNYYDFTYKDYVVVNQNYTKNRLPGISKWNLQALVDIELLNKIHVLYSNYYNSNQFLNDGNSVKEKGFIVGNLKVLLPFNYKNKELNVYFGAQNIYNTKYSAGYDLNAFGNRFYNPAATTNFYIGGNFIL